MSHNKRPLNPGVQCGHVGRFWHIPIWPWQRPHWCCDHCGRRLS